MSTFPGDIFDGGAHSLDKAVPDLTEDRLSNYSHREMVARTDVAPVFQAWLLADDAAFAAIPDEIRNAAITALQSGSGILVLARLPGPAEDIREGLLDALDLADVEPEEMHQ